MNAQRTPLVNIVPVEQNLKHTVQVVCKLPPASNENTRVFHELWEERKKKNWKLATGGNVTNYAAKSQHTDCTDWLD